MFPQFDPSKMDPKLLMELSELVQSLPREQLMRMQTLMHNAMAGFDVRKEMEEFEKSLPPGFREKLMSIVARQYAAGPDAPAGATAAGPATPIEEAEIVEETASSSAGPESAAEMNLREARLTLLRAVAAGRLSPEEAERLLFHGEG